MRLLLLAILLCATGVASAAPEAPTDRFASLMAISGQWQAQAANGPAMSLAYKVMSRSSVLVESWQAGTGGETMSVIHRDRDRVMATHYCAQGNQPRLILKDGDDKDFVFEFLDATNLPDAEASHLVRLQFTLNDDGSLDRIETYRRSGKDDSSRLHLSRIQPVSAAASHGS
ncbi:MAG: hypothetical protein IPP82_10030 [Xanthomonadales bacterium]|nr:hypothetical protein [Xanthomonadales bacterium]